jgi:hypothetical protein
MKTITNSINQKAACYHETPQPICEPELTKTTHDMSISSRFFLHPIGGVATGDNRPMREKGRR